MTNTEAKHQIFMEAHERWLEKKMDDMVQAEFKRYVKAAY